MQTNARMQNGAQRAGDEITIARSAVLRTRVVRSSLYVAWTAGRCWWRLAAICTGIVALLTPLSDRVPIASGVAVAILVGAALVDLNEQRLPNSIVLAAAAALLATLIVEKFLGTPIRLADVALGAIVMSAPLFVLHVLSPRAMGFGDVKAAAVLGAAIGAVDWELAVAALALAAGASALAGIARDVRTVALGPGLVAGAAIALAANALLLPPSTQPESRPVDTESLRHLSQPLWSSS